MESVICYALFPCPSSSSRFSQRTTLFTPRCSARKTHNSKPQIPKNLRYPRRTKPPPDFHIALHNDKNSVNKEAPSSDSERAAFSDSDEIIHSSTDTDNGELVWEADEIEAISSLFRGRLPQKPGRLNRERPLPLPLPHKIRPLGLPTSKTSWRTCLSSSARQPMSNQVYKNPAFLIGLAREIRELRMEDDVSLVLDQWARFLRKGSLSMTVRELGHMGIPERALHVFCWCQKQPHLFPDDRVLASTVEVLAKAHELKTPFDLDKFIGLASRSVYEAMVKGFIKGGNLRLALKLVLAATEGKRMLDASVYAKLILELGKNPDKRILALPLLEELARRDDLDLNQQDCTAIMKVCIKLEKFDIVEALYDWFKESGGTCSLVMYTTLIHSRYTEKKFREAMDVVWEMEASNCLLDLPAYCVLIKLFIALNDLSRTSRYFSKLKDAGFSPGYDIYRDLIRSYIVSGRLAKCKEVCKEAELAGFSLDEETRFELSQLEQKIQQESEA